jgi:acid phosphatase type 7
MLVADIQPRTMKGRNSNATNQVTSKSAPEAFYIYEAALNGLKPGATYTYSVEFGGVRTPTHRFRTITPGAASARFIVYGDTRSDPQVHAGLARSFRAHAPEFILHTGDLVAKGRDYGLWAKEFFTPMASIIDEVPFFSVIGNHEEDGTNYLAYFHLPGKELWYSLDVGPVHVLALDFAFQNSNSEQFRFASDDLAAARSPWKIVVLQTPVFNIGGHVSGWGQTNYLPLFLRTKVDLVLSGHSHLYERFRPVAPKGKPDWAITHVTTGGGGANLHPSFDHPALVVRETTNHYMVFDATRDALRAKAFRANGTLLDSFELEKKDGRMQPEYLAQVYPEEALKLFYDAVPSLASRAASLPNTNEAAQVLLNLVPLGSASEPAQLEITIAPMHSA